MKKIILIITAIILTGCLGETGKGYITKQCTKTENINGLTKQTEVKIKSLKGNVELIEIIETYDKNLDLTSITNSKKSEQNSYKNIKIEMNENVFTYTIETKNLTEEEKEKYNVKKEQHQQVKTFENQGYTCK